MFCINCHNIITIYYIQL